MSELIRYSLTRSRRPFEFGFDKTRVMPPDSVSERIGVIAGSTIDKIRGIRGEPNGIIKVLEMGVGTGVMLMSMLGTVANINNLEMFGFDLDEYCVKSSAENINRQMEQYESNSLLNVWQADWNHSYTWRTLLKCGPFDVIFFNPPYLPAKEELDPPDEYAGVPRFATHTDDEFGLQHYESVVPKLPAIFSTQPGSSIFIRKSSRFIGDTEQAHRYDDIIRSVLYERPLLGYKDVVEQVTQLYRGNWAHLEQV